MVKPTVKKPEGLKCVVYYGNQKKYSRIKKLSKANETESLKQKENE